MVWRLKHGVSTNPEKGPTILTSQKSTDDPRSQNTLSHPPSPLTAGMEAEPKPEKRSDKPVSKACDACECGWKFRTPDNEEGPRADRETGDRERFSRLPAAAFGPWASPDRC